MSDYKNGDTASWDASQVRRSQAGHTGRSQGNPSQQPQRRRKRRRINPVLYILCVLVASAILAGVGWLLASDLCAFSRDIPSTTKITIEITADDDMGSIAEKLQDAGLIRYKWFFRLFAAVTGASEEVGIGTYELNTDMDYRALISSMGSSSANRMTTTVTIPEGMTEAQIFSLLEEKGVSTVEQLEEAAANYDFKFSFLKGVVPLGDPKRLEGYLFPDTYEFYMGEEPVSVLNKMILRFDEIFTDEMRQEVQNDGRTIQDVVTVASMIEKETDGSDQAKIASVIYNRLDNPTSETAGYLNIDATILYATGGTEVDLNADTPYNTRTHKGLTPTAIASPGVDALKAAVYPDSTRYYFYALGDDGKHHFFATYREQQNFIASQERYQNG